MLSGSSKFSVTVIAVTLCLVVKPLYAQDDPESERRDTVRVDQVEIERQREAVEVERDSLEREMEIAAREMEVAVQQHQEAMRSNADTEKAEMAMRRAEKAMAVAAQRMAELSIRRLPSNIDVRTMVRGKRGPVLGVTIGAYDDKGPVEGVAILGVSPGGAAEESGLQAGDVITALNDESLMADSSKEADRILIDFMEGVEEGDVLDVEILRDGRTRNVELRPRSMAPGTFAFNLDSGEIAVPRVQMAPGVGDVNRYVWISESGGFGDMELVKLSEDLGSYFGTNEGLLVVRAPENEALQLKDGDVIQNIDGREPNSASHAIRILGSYESGETVKIEIMRNQRKQTISVEVPDDLRSWNKPTPVAPPPPIDPVAPAVAVLVPQSEE